MDKKMAETLINNYCLFGKTEEEVKASPVYQGWLKYLEAFLSYDEFEYKNWEKGKEMAEFVLEETAWQLTVHEGLARARFCPFSSMPCQGPKCGAYIWAPDSLEGECWLLPIKEVGAEQQTIRDIMNYIRDIVSPEEFEEWLAKRAKEQKQHAKEQTSKD